MKIKIDFITNSSSTCFIVWGIQFDVGYFKSRFPNLVDLLFDEFKDSNDYDEDINNIQLFLDSWMFRELFQKRADRFGLESNWSNDGQIAVGINPFEMQDNETLLEFKKFLLSNLNLLFSKSFKLSQIKRVEIINTDY